MNMKLYKIFRWFLKASALTTVMFIMQACYGSPNVPPEMPDDMEVTEEDSVQESEMQVETPQIDSAQLEILKNWMF